MPPLRRDLDPFTKQNKTKKIIPFAHCFQNLLLCLATGGVNFSLTQKGYVYGFYHPMQSKVDIHVYALYRSKPVNQSNLQCLAKCWNGI